MFAIGALRCLPLGGLAYGVRLGFRAIGPLKLLINNEYGSMGIRAVIGHLSVKSEEVEPEIVRVKPSRAFSLHRDEIRRLVQQSRASNPRVFGSALRGGDTESSDLDILVDPLPGATLFDLGGLQIALQELLGVPVDLLTPGDLPHRARERVLREAVPV